MNIEIDIFWAILVAIFLSLIFTRVLRDIANNIGNSVYYFIKKLVKRHDE